MKTGVRRRAFYRALFIERFLSRALDGERLKESPKNRIPDKSDMAFTDTYQARERVGCGIL